MITVFSLGEKSTAKPIFSCYFSRKQWRKAQWIFFRIFTAQSNRCTYRRQRMFKKLHQHKLKCGISRILIYFDRFLQCSTKNCSVKNLPFQRLSRETKIIDIDVFVSTWEFCHLQLHYEKSITCTSPLSCKTENIQHLIVHWQNFVSLT